MAMGAAIGVGDASHRLSAVQLPFRESVHRRSPRRRGSAAGVDVIASTTRVVSRGGQLPLGGRFALGGLEQPLEKWAAPAAAGSGAEALGQLPHAPRPLDANEILHLPPADVKAETELVVGVHASNTNHEDTKEYARKSESNDKTKLGTLIITSLR